MKIANFVIVILSLGLLVVAASAANAGCRADLVEDRRDRIENIIDEAYDRGPLDVIEDKLDRAEDRHDRRHLDCTPHRHKRPHVPERPVRIQG